MNSFLQGENIEFREQGSGHCSARNCVFFFSPRRHSGILEIVVNSVKCGRRSLFCQTEKGNSGQYFFHLLLHGKIQKVKRERILNFLSPSFFLWDKQITNFFRPLLSFIFFFHFKSDVKLKKKMLSKF